VSAARHAARIAAAVRVTNVGGDMAAVSAMLDDIEARTGALPAVLLGDANHGAQAGTRDAASRGVIASNRLQHAATLLAGGPQPRRRVLGGGPGDHYPYGARVIWVTPGWGPHGPAPSSGRGQHGDDRRDRRRRCSGRRRRPIVRRLVSGGRPPGRSPGRADPGAAPC
jgi:hypothetical protein